MSEPWPYVVVGVQLLISTLASGHALLNKRESTIWVALIWFAPFVGALLYATLGVNRVQGRAHALRSDQTRPDMSSVGEACPAALLQETLGAEGAHLEQLARLVGRVTQRPLFHGNRIALLRNGDEAYPAMLEAIMSARRSIALSSYIFSDDQAGRCFVDALADATSRGVEVRVLVDDVGRRYSWPPVTRALTRRGIRHATFLPTVVPWHLAYANLRNHRKILVVDGVIGFTGGINIRDDNLFELATTGRICIFGSLGPASPTSRRRSSPTGPSAPMSCSRVKTGFRHSGPTDRLWLVAFLTGRTAISTSSAGQCSVPSGARVPRLPSSRPTSYLTHPSFRP